MVQPDDHMNNHSGTISALKHCIAGLEKENHDLRGAETSQAKKSCVYRSPFHSDGFVHVDVSFAAVRSSITVPGV